MISSPVRIGRRTLAKSHAREARASSRPGHGWTRNMLHKSPGCQGCDGGTRHRLHYSIFGLETNSMALNSPDTGMVGSHVHVN